MYAYPEPTQLLIDRPSKYFFHAGIKPAEHSTGSQLLSHTAPTVTSSLKHTLKHVDKKGLETSFFNNVTYLYDSNRCVYKCVFIFIHLSAQQHL